MNIKKQKICGLLTVVMTGAFFITLLWGYGQYQQNKHALTLLENEYQRAYYNYLAAVEDMALNAGKACNAGALQQGVLLGGLHTLALGAADQLARLPIQQNHYQSSVAYLNRVGAYAAALTQHLGAGQALSEKQVADLGNIYRQLQTLHKQMEDMEELVAAGTIVFARAQGGWWQAARHSLAGSQAVQGTAAAAEAKTADGYFSRANAFLDDTKPFEYAGPYAPHLSTQQALGLAGLPQISMAQAEEAAREFLAAGGQNIAQLQEQQEIIINENWPLYNMVFTADNGQKIYIALARAGGKIIYYTYDRTIGEAKITNETALNNAQNLLHKAGYLNMSLIGRQRIDDTLVLQYAPLIEGIMYYPDRVNISVALDNGEIVAYNSLPYWQHNHQRALPQTEYITEANLAYIANVGEEEVLCYEIRAVTDEEEYLNYIDVESMLDKQILRSYTAKDGSFYTR